MHYLKLAIATLLLAACNPDNGGSDNNVAPSVADNTSAPPLAPSAAQESLEASRCRVAAQAMIDIAGEAANEPSSRPERREARRQLFEDWTARLAAGEDPCVVYEDIGRAATTF